ncbi:unnamed protein product [Leptosia nina]|uniref:Uncharacterized protein n=1 Tax=Leptosia nina TaxID=320188 RepID=A0AAV1J066_9NEOP
MKRRAVQSEKCARPRGVVRIGASEDERTLGVAVADTSARRKNKACGAAAPPAGAKGARRGGAAGRTAPLAAAGGVSEPAPPAASRLTPAARAGVATERVTIAPRVYPRELERVMDVA